MGIEYNLRFSAPNAEAVADLLRRMSDTREVDTPEPHFELGADPAGQDWPEATATIEPDGLYFCDNCGGGGRALLGQLIARLTSYFGPVTIEEL